MQRDSQPRRKPFLGITICVLVGVVLGVIHNRLTARSVGDPVTGAIRTVTTPLVAATDAASDWISRQFGWLMRGRGMDGENRRLREENTRLRGELAQLREAEATAQRLQKQIGFATSSPPAKIACSVIALRPQQGYETLIIDRGTRDGVTLRSVVVSPAGLVGHVYDVTINSAAVLLITDADSAVGALVQRPESRAVGVCKGDRSALLTLAYLNQDAGVKPGDTIVTSGLGGGQAIFPKGIEIGTVQSVEVDAPVSSRIVKVRPAVDFSRIEEVYVLR